MRILSNFDTNLAKELYEKAVATYGEERVLLVYRDVIYMWIRVFFPALTVMLPVAMILIYSIELLDHDRQRMRWSMWLLLIFLMMAFIWRGLKKWINYRMDFTLITPKQILSYDQDFILDRYARSLDMKKVKSVNIEKKGFLRSLFNFGSIVFFSEGDVMSTGDDRMGNIRLNFIKKPRRLREKIIDVIKSYDTTSQ